MGGNESCRPFHYKGMANACLAVGLSSFHFLFLFAFALRNTDLVSVRFFFGADWQAPLIIIVLAFFAGGAALGVLSLLGTVFSLRREVSRLKNTLKQQTQNE